MAKANSPIRVQNNLMQSATAVGALMHRSAAEQIEYWAALGQKLSNTITPESLLCVNAGLMKIKLEPVADANVDFDDIMQTVTTQANSGQLTQSIADGKVKYQLCTSQENQKQALLEQVSADGTIAIGRFINGEFIEQSANEK